MPPRQKKQRSQYCTTIQDIHPLQQELIAWVDTKYKERKQVFTAVESGPEMQIKTSFLDIVQQRWANANTLVGKTFALALATGILPRGTTNEEFQAKYLHASWPPTQGRMLSSILMWNFSHASLWKGEVPMSDILPLAKSMAAGRFREAPPPRA